MALIKRPDPRICSEDAFSLNLKYVHKNPGTITDEGI